MWTVNVDVFIYGLYGQATIIILTILIAYLLYFMFRHKGKVDQKRVAQITNYLVEDYKSKQESKLPFKRSWKRLSYLIRALGKADDSVKRESKSWEQYKVKFIEKYMLPMARKNVGKTAWFARFLAAKTFAMYALPRDEKLIAKLMLDHKPAVVLAAIHAVKHLPTKELIYELIHQISLLRRKSYDLYLAPFKDIAPSARKLIVEHLKAEKNPYKRDIDYRILMLFAPMPLKKESHKDAKSEVLELSLSAIRFIGYAEGKDALPFLHAALQDKRWQVKVAIIQVLGIMKDPTSIDFIATMCDSPEHWVRANAADALKKFGKKGIEKLRALLKGEALGTAEIEYVLQDISA